MGKNKSLLFCLSVALIPAMMVSCKKGSVNHTPAVSISDTSRTVTENAGTVSITVKLSEAASQNIKLNYALSGTAILNGDFEVDSASQITIAAGSTTATLKFTIYDDPVVESDKTIHVKFSSTANVSFTNADATITIKDNDVSHAANGLQTDLTWDGGALVNLDLYVADNVIITNNTVTNFNLVDGSKNLKGFESVMINNSDTNGLYYLVVFYESGARAVNLVLNSNGPNVTNSTINDSFSASDAGSAYFYGPVTKNGSSYSRQSGSFFNLEGMKPYIYRGKIK